MEGGNSEKWKAESEKAENIGFEMRFVFISTKGDWGGSEPLWCDAAQKALQEGREVVCVLPETKELHARHKELIARGAELVLRPPRLVPTLGNRLRWKLAGISNPETHWWRERFRNRPDAICVSQGGTYCALSMPGLIPWLLECGVPYGVVCHSHRNYALPNAVYRAELRKYLVGAAKVCFVAAEHVRAAGRYLGVGLENAVVVQNPVNLNEELVATTKDTLQLPTTGLPDASHLTTGQPEGTTNYTNHTNFLTTDGTDGHGYLAGLRLASQAGAAFSNPSSSGLARDSENTSLTRSAIGPASALRADEDRRSEIEAGVVGSVGGNQLADSEVFFKDQSQAGLQMGSEKNLDTRGANAPDTSGDQTGSESESVVIREIRGEKCERSKQVPCSATESAPVALMACVARLEIRDKGQDLLLEALADPVWKERDFRLDFYGSGPDREILEDLISFYGLGDKVRIAGFESDIRKIWKEHALLVLPSISEGTPISLIEAQLCGRASLVTNVDGNPEWVEEGRTGFLAEAPTVHHLRLALERAWENRHLWREMGEAAREACLAKRDADPAGTLLRLLKAAAEA